MKIQAVIRGRYKRQTLLLSRNAAHKVQVWVRGRLQRRWYLAFKEQVRRVATGFTLTSRGRKKGVELSRNEDVWANSTVDSKAYRGGRALVVSSSGSCICDCSVQCFEPRPSYGVVA